MVSCQHVSRLFAYLPNCQPAYLCAYGSACGILLCICFLAQYVASARLPITMAGCLSAGRAALTVKEGLRDRPGWRAL